MADTDGCKDILSVAVLVTEGHCFDPNTKFIKDPSGINIIASGLTGWFIMGTVLSNPYPLLNIMFPSVRLTLVLIKLLQKPYLDGQHDF